MPNLTSNYLTLQHLLQHHNMGSYMHVILGCIFWVLIWHIGKYMISEFGKRIAKETTAANLHLKTPNQAYKSLNPVRSVERQQLKRQKILAEATAITDAVQQVKKRKKMETEIPSNGWSLNFSYLHANKGVPGHQHISFDLQQLHGDHKQLQDIDRVSISDLCESTIKKIQM